MAIHNFIDNCQDQLDLPVKNGLPDEDESEEQKLKREKFAMLAESLAWIMTHCWIGPRGVPRDARTAFRRFVAVTMTLRPDLVGNRSFAQMGSKIRTSAALLCWMSLDFSDRAGVHFRRSRRQSSRVNQSEGQKKSWANGRRAK